MKRHRFVKILSGSVLFIAAMSFLLLKVYATVPSTYTYSGTVTNVSGDPVSGINIQLVPANGNVAATCTGSSGEFSLPVLADLYALRITGFCDDSDHGLPTITSMQLAGQDADINLTSSDLHQDLRLTASTATVIVKDFAGNPINGANVSAQTYHGSTPRLENGPNDLFPFATPSSFVSSNTTDVNGTSQLQVLKGLAFEIIDGPVSNNSNICASLPGSTLSKCMEYPLTVNGDVTVELNFPAINTYSGSVTNELNVPISGVNIQLVANNGTTSTACTDSAGYFSLPVFADLYTLRTLGFCDDGNHGLPTITSMQLAGENADIDLRNGSLPQNLRLTTSTVTVVVRDSMGNPISDVAVKAQTYHGSTSRIENGPSDMVPFNYPGSFGADSTTAYDGTAQVNVLRGLAFEIVDGPMSNNSNICAHLATGQAVCMTAPLVIDNDVSIELTFPETNTYSGTITNQSNQPVSGVNVQLAADNGNVAATCTGSSGEFSLPVLADLYALRITGFCDDSDHGLPTITSMQLAGQDADINLTSSDLHQDLRLTTSTVTVIVVDFNGIPVQNAYVSAQTYHGSTSRTENGPNDLIPFNYPASFSSGNTTDSNGASQLQVLKGLAFEIIDGPASNNSNICASLPGSGQLVCMSVPITINNNLIIELQQPLPIPSPPTGLAGESPAQSPYLTWDDTTFATSYNIYRDNILVGSSLSTNFSDTEAVPGQYQYHVTAVNDTGESPPSDSISVIVEDSTPQTFTLLPTADTYIREGQDNRNHGADTEMDVRSSGNNRALVRFDQSAIDSTVGNGTIISAILKLKINDNGANWGSTGRTVDIHRLLTDWAEGNGMANDRGMGSGATWNCAVDSNIQNQSRNCIGSTEWEMRQPNNPSVHPWFAEATDSILVTNVLSGTIEYDVTVDLQNFLDGEISNYGWLIKKTEESQSGWVNFGTKESALMPELVITYHP